MKKPLLFLSALALAGSALAQTFITFGSGGTTGVYFPVATGMARLVNEANIGVRANARSTGGSVFNINAIASGELQMALAQNDIAYYAYNGTGIPAFDGRPVRSIRAVGVLYPEVVHVVARAGAGINTIADLRGKRVVIGDVGSGTEQNARQILEAYGLSLSDLREAIRVNPNNALALMQDGRADAFFFTGGLGAAVISQAAQTLRIQLVEVEYNRVQELAKKYPFYRAFNIEGGLYRGVDVTTPSVAVFAMWIAAESVSPDVVYNMMKATFDNPEFRSIHPNLQRFFNVNTAARNLPIPLHPGAERYYREKRIIR
ncbi:TRAP transporter substrate-binding protein [Meiothermus sp. QL-1]|uniref:TAXI family TRAP transporter solute-binding subunit n=1 Tax=Meiothermus sp. QL-1 TaxID=2058095 RepID=UPI000E0B993A|nr:TAXI family TRAP transporter solute-binding subunit [Meiothermus sp. QL-1]RDI95705.1 TRAP transporter substrate-binding protein [Meiothermus sp. QL-1]